MVWYSSTLKAPTAFPWSTGQYVLQYGGKGIQLWLYSAQTQITQGRSPAWCRPLVVHQEVHREDGVTLGPPHPPWAGSPHPPRVTLGSTRIAFSSPPPSLGGCQPYVWERYLLKTEINGFSISHNACEISFGLNTQNKGHFSLK